MYPCVVCTVRRHTASTINGVARISFVTRTEADTECISSVYGHENGKKLVELGKKNQNRHTTTAAENNTRRAKKKLLIMY